jgi:hypothetical protein
MCSYGTVIRCLTTCARGRPYSFRARSTQAWSSSWTSIWNPCDLFLRELDDEPSQVDGLARNHLERHVDIGLRIRQARLDELVEVVVPGLHLGQEDDLVSVATPADRVIMGSGEEERRPIVLLGQEIPGLAPEEVLPALDDEGAQHQAILRSQILQLVPAHLHPGRAPQHRGHEDQEQCRLGAQSRHRFHALPPRSPKARLARCTTAG